MSRGSAGTMMGTRDDPAAPAGLRRLDAVVTPLVARFRRRRMRLFGETFAPTAATRVLDIGGTPYNWAFVPVRPALTLVNVGERERVEDGIRYLAGDGRALDFPDGAFDIVYSNSVIEHVGTFADMERFAREVRRLAPRYMVQTPNRRFPVDPHLLTPFVHWLPRDLQRAVVRNGTVVGWLTRPSPEAVRHIVDATRMLTVAEMRRLFPDARIVVERFGGLVKSIIAIRA